MEGPAPAKNSVPFAYENMPGRTRVAVAFSRALPALRSVLFLWERGAAAKTFAAPAAPTHISALAKERSVLHFLFKHLVRNALNARRPARQAGRGRPSLAFRPWLEGLEDRTVPSTATHFLVLVPEATDVGQATDVDVIALDASNHRVGDYTGTVQLSSTDTSTTSGGSALPTTYTFTAADRGAHDFVVTPGTTGTETLSAADTTTSSITGSASLLVDPAPVATHFLLLTSPSFGCAGQTSGGQASAGVATNVRVVALDDSNHVVTNYTGTVQLSSTDSATTVDGTSVPTTYTFTTADHGSHVFAVTPGATGTETLTATDTSNNSLTGSVTLQVNAAPVATHFLVVVPQNVQAGKPAAVVVEALDASNHVVPNYTGTVQLTSSDTAAALGGATLPATYTFTAADHGVHAFLVTFATNGSQTVTATDTSNSSLTGSATTTVGTSGTPETPSLFVGQFGRHRGPDRIAILDSVFLNFRGRF
jgi:hypothetical protein